MSEFNEMVRALKATLDQLEQKEIKSQSDFQSRVTSNNAASTPVKSMDFAAVSQKYIDFTYENPTIYHVVSHFSGKLEDNGFTYLSEKKTWSDLKPGRYYTARNGSSLIAFVVGPDWTAKRGVGAIGSHIDALTVALKPNSTKSKVDGYELLGVANYAGTLSDSWWDRDLGVGGRLLIRKDGKLVTQLVDSSPNPIAHIPTLAPHFGTPAVGPFNKETQAVPVIGYSSEDDEPPTEEEKSAPLYGKHSLNVLRYVAKLGGVKVSDIYQTDLQLYDVQKGSFGGLNKEFIYSPRIDDRICSYAAIEALVDAANGGELPDDGFSLVGLFDHEEIGSATRTGIKGGLVESTVARVLASEYYASATPVEEDIRLAYANTIILSADVSHLLNPNFSSVYLEHHKPLPNTGLALALDPNGHMATDSTGVALAEELARINGDKLQYFQIRNDSRSGGTIGPSISLQTGARTIDLGIPQLSMHSIRAATGARDLGLGIKFFTGFFINWRTVYDTYSDL
ncbi:aspartyl aminopeptidase M18 family protein [Yamadazyma tenuis]|uniref:Peptidase M18, aminopeptidase I n=1 Tax=Candida tenuis (strain ATCC 10573 / BCRC 21748 / CBS 615 / JCM 9827 / NBRC 10315 / NRRL Y-1498 / VKM Y-70) TaxID=590646 RepID=G3B5X9_CANTC|nr:peptidase M18, aminopeptidase I [Yamadazyma tenuis ATCC 10573]XP_006687429.1 uncharacterized protein CANTEDRAFT_114626 [Yamadazyma tenuis ATCC 10573]EGV63635.1 peptidase M18, aminopeptidase I [Yamadazyma tenuis ATCC 10573]EGV63636.1 hypothetical protein CANTEDRAFT_114626 [Yamadazyma tenuis ATCC 10573]WEJ96849.1 aspartyl aminopeptidase M18 family protein [Yamadazyma tenuis]